MIQGVQLSNSYILQPLTTIPYSVLAAVCRLPKPNAEISARSSQPTMKNTVTEKEDQDKIWNSINREFEFINGAQISNSFIVLMALSESKESLSTTQVSEIISSRSK